MPLPWLYALYSLPAAVEAAMVAALWVPVPRRSQCLRKQTLQAIRVTRQAVQLPISEAGLTIT